MPVKQREFTAEVISTSRTTPGRNEFTSPRGRQRSDSSYSDYREYARGIGWKVWVKLPGNPAVVQTPLASAIPIPDYKKADEINVPDSWVDP